MENRFSLAVSPIFFYRWTNTDPFSSIIPSRRHQDQRGHRFANLKVNPLQELLQSFGFFLSTLSVCLYFLGGCFLFRDDIHINKFEVSHLIVQHSCPHPHWRFADNVYDVSFLKTKKYTNQFSENFGAMTISRKNGIKENQRKMREYDNGGY